MTSFDWIVEAVSWLGQHLQHRTKVWVWVNASAESEPGVTEARIDSQHSAILDCLEEGDHTLAEIASNAELTTPTARRRISELVQAGKIARADAGRPGLAALYTLIR